MIRNVSPSTMAVSLSVALKPLFFMMFITGMYSSSAERINTCLMFLKRVSCFLLTALCFSMLFINIAKLVLDALVSGTIQSLYAFSYQLGGLFLAVSFCFFCPKHMSTFFKEFECYKKECCANEETHYKSILIIGLIGVLYSCIGMSVAVPYFLTVNPCSTDFSHISEFIASVNCSKVIFCIMFYFSSQVYLTTFVTYLTVWRLLQSEANGINIALSSLDRHALTETPEVIETIRLRHADLCHVIGSANQFVRHIVAAVYGAGLPCMLLMMRGLIYNHLTVIHLSAMGGMLSFFILGITIITLTGAALCLKMHEPMEFLYRLDVQRMTGKGTEIVSMFLSRMQSGSIGFNVYNLFTVDTSTITMICGTLLTYALVIIQFQSPGTSTDPPLPVTSAYTDQPDIVNTTSFLDQ